MSNKWVEIEEILTGLLADLTVAVEVLKDYLITIEIQPALAIAVA